MNYETEVLVVGGGNAGCAAAIAAARNGARVMLVERYGFLGGTATAALVGPWMTFHAGRERVVGGIAQEIVERLMAMGASPGHIEDASSYVPTITPFDAEYHKALLFEMMEEAGVRLLLHSLFVEPVIENDGKGKRITGAVFQTLSGRREVRAERIIDATADAHVSAASGVPFQIGDERDALVQPVSMIFRLSHVDLDETAAFLREHPDQIRTHLKPEQLTGSTLSAVAGFWNQWQAARSAGEVHIQREIVSFFASPYPDEVVVNMTRVTRVNPLDPDDLTRAEIESRRQVMELVSFFKNRIPGFKNCRLAGTATQVGIRETRRIIGEYVLTADDLLNAVEFDDAIARSGYPIDIHNPKGEGTFTKRLPEGKTYEIPFRCLIPQAIENLLVAGRCISTTHEAVASTRLTPTVMTIGQAAGTAMAISLRGGLSPRRINVRQLHDTLIEQGVDLRR
ncbi:MAG: FAD-dependent oxidoreductase [Blastocatellales bacterium]